MVFPPLFRTRFWVAGDFCLQMTRENSLQREDLVEAVYSLWYTCNMGVTVMQRIADNPSFWRMIKDGNEIFKG